MYSVYQHWDPLRTCLVGKSYSPEFYSFIDNPKVRTVMERIARETEEDYQKLISLLERFNVKVIRPHLSDDYTAYMYNGKIMPPPMCPRDWTIMLGDKFYFKSQFIQSQHEDRFNKNYFAVNDIMWDEALTHINQQGNQIINDIRVVNPPKDPELLYWFNSATTTRIGKDLYFGTNAGWWNKGKVLDRFKTEALDKLKKKYQDQFPNYRCHVIDTEGHADGTFCPVVPGLIVSLCDIPTYKDTFPDWEVIYLKDQGWNRVKPFLDLKNKNRGKWWVPGEELNDEFTEFVESWLGHWVGYVEESMFDVNMLVIDEKNVACSGYSDEVFNAFSKRGITPHIVNFRHRYFWDGGLHCITSDISREGSIQDYFPNRNLQSQ
jgi:hypothetical protein